MYWEVEVSCPQGKVDTIHYFMSVYMYVALPSVLGAWSMAQVLWLPFKYYYLYVRDSKSAILVQLSTCHVTVNTGYYVYVCMYVCVDPVSEWRPKSGEDHQAMVWTGQRVLH